MSEKIAFDPYLKDVERLHKLDTDQHVAKTKVAYYGEMPDGYITASRINNPPVEVQDDSGLAKYSVLISGDLVTAKTVLVKPMAWSDHPGRGFEALRETLIADDKEKLAVVGISFPGTFLTSDHMTPKQKETLKQQDFSYIGAQQWQAIDKALHAELGMALGSLQIDKKMRGYDFVIGGSSQGSANAVGLFQSAPQWANVRSLGLAEAVSLEEQGALDFRTNFILGGNKHFKDYTKVNPYNQYPSLGPDYGALSVPSRIVQRPASHIGAVIKAMRRGGDVRRILDTVRERDIKDLAVTLATGSEDIVAPYEASRRAAIALNVSARILATAVAWEGHHHPVMENLANAQHTFRGFAK
jgi:hypothetical protein